ncbi:MAG: xylulokinase, partial [Anaerolineae bacterium]|nr:xylulokinase [Anaerolineae bacterium]
MPTYLLGIDSSTTATKALLIDAAGAVVAVASTSYPFERPRPGWTEQRPDLFWDGTLHSIRAALDKTGATGQDVAAVGLTGQMHGMCLLDVHGAAIRPAILWNDQRTVRQCEAITQTIGAQRVLDITGNPVLTGFTAPKILWLRDNEPANYERVKKVLLPKDYIRLLLTGEFATDVADASGTLLFDVKNRRWHTELMGLLGIDSDFMPPSFEGPEITGTLTAEAAKKTGLPAGIPVVAGGGDQAANGVGCGIVRTGVISSSLGTSGVVFAFADDVSTDPQGRVHTFCHSVPGKWHVMGVMLSAGGALRWYRDALCQVEV